MGAGWESEWMSETDVVSTEGNVFLLLWEWGNNYFTLGCSFEILILKVNMMCCAQYAFSKFCLPSERHTSINLETHAGEPLTRIILGQIN